MKPSRNFKGIENDMKQLLAEAEAYTANKLIKKLSTHADNLKAATDAMLHSEKVAAYVAFKEAEEYINGLKADIAETGVTLTDTFNASQVSVKSIGNDTFRTFDKLKAGRIYEAKNGTKYLATSFTADFGGSETTLIRLTNKCYSADEKQTPYNGIDCRFSRSTGHLIVAKFDALKTDTVTIDGKMYLVKSAYLNCDSYREYELEQIA